MRLSYDQTKQVIARIKAHDSAFSARFERASSDAWHELFFRVLEGLLLSSKAGKITVLDREEALAIAYREEAVFIGRMATDTDRPTAERLIQLVLRCLHIAKLGERYKPFSLATSDQVNHGIEISYHERKQATKYTSDTDDRIGSEIQSASERLSFLRLDNPISEDGGTAVSTGHDFIADDSVSPIEQAIDQEFLSEFRTRLQQTSGKFFGRDYRYALELMDDAHSKQAAMNVAKEPEGKKAYQTDVYKTEERILSVLESMGISKDSYFTYTPKRVRKETTLWESGTQMDRNHNNK